MTNHPTLPTFSELCEKYQLDDEALWDLAHLSQVPKSVIDVMLLGTPVEHEEASKVLAALCKETHTSWTLETTDIPYVGEIPTFQRLCQRCKIDSSRLSTQSGVPLAIIDQMLVGHPVSISDARNVLAMLSRIAGKNYNLTTVDVKVERAGTP